LGMWTFVSVDLTGAPSCVCVRRWVNVSSECVCVGSLSVLFCCVVVVS
jgi:hypothetical protein